MIKLELGEVAVIMAMIENTNFNGKDVLKVADIIRKLQKEMEKLNPQYVRDMNGKK
tara:strand:- start:999 stop:1166 length:168 start_codon:yes stop_codon:yes gene_type:complete